MSSTVLPTHHHHNLKSTSDEKAPSFDEVSKLFSLPLSDAADTLGICPSVLKKVCYENGIERWPYRKFLLGKSIEEIRDAAAGKRNIERAKPFNASDERINNSSSSGVSSSLSSQLQNKNSIYVKEMAKSRGVFQHQGNKNIYNRKPQNVLHPSLKKETFTRLDEFKYGFPSEGLTTHSNRWWGCLRPDGNEENSSKEVVDKDQSKDGVTLQFESENSEGETERREPELHGAALLSAVRKRTMEEGRNAYKLNIYNNYQMKRLGRRERTLLHQIFDSSMPTEWRNEFL